MISKAIDKIISIYEPKTLKLNERDYSTGTLHKILEPTPEPLSLNTLTGIKDYIDRNIDKLNLDEIFIIVDSYNLVSVYSHMYGGFKQRDKILYSSHLENEFSFRRFYELENFIIALQANFEKTDHLTQILSIVGNLKEERVKNVADDGITQTVTAKKGISIGVQVDLPNPVTLKPFRTFLEVDQPESQFVFRMQDGPTCALFEADGGKWKLDAILRVKAWLVENLPEGITVIA